MTTRVSVRLLCSLTIIAVGLAPQLARAAASPDKIWQTVDQIPQEAGLQRGIQPERFKAFTVDANRLHGALSTAPLEFTPARAGTAPTEITLPKPDGSFARFRIEEVALMEPALAARHPGIKTYRGRDVNDPTASLQLDVNPKTLHAQVLSPSGTYYIDPYWQRDGRLYMSYNKSDLAPRVASLSASSTSSWRKTARMHRPVRKHRRQWITRNPASTCAFTVSPAPPRCVTANTTAAPIRTCPTFSRRW
jgi:hypothetical protein